MYNSKPCTPCIRGGGGRDLSSEFSPRFVSRPAPRRRRARCMRQRYVNDHSRVPTNSIFIDLIVSSPGNDENAIAPYVGASMRGHRFFPDYSGHQTADNIKTDYALGNKQKLADTISAEIRATMLSTDWNRLILII